MIKFFQDEAAEKFNMVLVIKRSWPSNEKRLGSLLLACEKYGVFQKRRKDQSESSTPIQRKRSITKLTNCPFSLEGREFARGQWAMSVICGTHNHDHPEILLSHAYRGRVKGEQMEMVKLLSSHGTPPKPILSIMHGKEKGKCVTSRKQLYNAKAKLKMEAMGERSLTQDMLFQLTEKNYFWCARKKPGATDQIGDLFLSHEGSRHLLKLFPYVVIIDSTYKTNQ